MLTYCSLQVPPFPKLSGTCVYVGSLKHGLDILLPGWENVTRCQNEVDFPTTPIQVIVSFH